MRNILSRLGSLVSVVTTLTVGASLAACSAAKPGSGFGEPETSADAGPGTNEGTTTTASGGDAGLGSLGTGNVDSGAADALETTDGPIDLTPACDMGLAVDDSDAANFARAIGICTNASTAGYGLVSATYSNGFGSTTLPATGQTGLLPKFGSVIIPREGSAMGVISSGFAREYDDIEDSSNDPNADFVSSGGNPMDGTNYPTGTAPNGYPQAAQGCMQDNLVNDMVDVKLTLKAPPNATGFKFDFDFYSSEWPNYVCSNFNDAFNAYVTSQETTGANVSFDSNNNPIAVNTDFFNRCTQNTPVGCLSADNFDNDGNPIPNAPSATAACMAGPAELGGTGFGDTYATDCASNNVTATLGGATGWLTTQAPIAGGEQFTIEFMIWDAGDGLLDSSVLIDNFQWIGGVPVMTGTQRPPQ